MSDEIFSSSVRIERPAADVFAWHEQPGAFARLSPPWERVEVTAQAGGIRDGARVSLRTKVGPGWAGWEIIHRDYVEGRQFRDVQVSGPFARWEHLHRFEPAGENACVLTDEIRYRLPAGALGRWGGGAFVRRKLERMFAYRHAVTKTDLERADKTVPAKRVLVSGASGVVGRALLPFLQTQGHAVRRLVRGEPRSAEEFCWNPAEGEIDPAAWAEIDAVVHLAGENVAGGRWTEKRKREILESRVAGTRTLVAAIAGLAPGARPEVLVSASAVGFYGECGDQPVGETAAGGAGFLAEVCEAWEREVRAVEAWGVRAVCLRTGVVLTPAGGALAKLLAVFGLGVGGPIGNGRQWMSWIGPDDLAALYLRAVADRSWTGAFNAVAPEPVTNAEFATVLARMVRRPAVLRVPAWALKAVFGQMGKETLLVSTRAVPERVLAAGYAFREAELEGALRRVLGR